MINMHIYTDESKSIMLPSVTSIISFVKTKDEFEGLIRWSNSLGFKHQGYFTTLNSYADFGTLVHSALSDIVTDKPVSTDITNKIALTDIVKFKTTIANFKKFYELQAPTTIYSEKSFLSKKLGFGGTVDWISIEDEDIILTDFKTSSDFRESHFIQLAAYVKLIEDQTDLKIDNVRILLVSTPTFRFKELTMDELAPYYRKFELIFDLYKEYNPLIDINDSSENIFITVTN